MKKVYEVRFWNIADENIRVAGKYSHPFDTFEDAWDAANALLPTAYRYGAVAMDINNNFWSIEND